MPFFQMRSRSMAAGLSALALLGCGEGLTGTTGTQQDLQQVTTDVSSAPTTTPDAAATIAFQTFSDDVGQQIQTATRTLIRTAAGYQSFFGHAPPAAVDFSHEWVMFYGAGIQSTGDQASFLVVFRSGGNLIAVTRLATPSSACPRTSLSVPAYALIKFPAQPGTTAQFYKSDVVTQCDFAPVTCGGFAGTACPGLGKCVDDPTDSCDPAAGGADCGGICSCALVPCPSGSPFDSSPAVCACVPSKPPVCGPVCDIYCQFGNVLDPSGCPTCACNPDPCATVDCAGGTHCDSGKCIPDGVACGGLAGGPCPGAGKCVDNPYDACDPAAGAVDCPGICQCVQNVLCTTSSTFDASPSVCACVAAAADPCPKEKCPTPAPASPTKTCADGSTAGPVCAPNSAGACAWTVTTCPPSS
jgi:hypothetical protein